MVGGLVESIGFLKVEVEEKEEAAAAADEEDEDEEEEEEEEIDCNCPLRLEHRSTCITPLIHVLATDGSASATRPVVCIVCIEGRVCIVGIV